MAEEFSTSPSQGPGYPAPSPVVDAWHQRRGKTYLEIGLEVLLISVGVFLGLMGEQWRERAQQRELADASLRRLRTEIQANRASVGSVRDYHVATQARIQKYLASDPKSRQTDSLEMRGLQPASFEHSAWDLTLATESLAHIDAELSFALARVYNVQQGYTEMTRGMLQAMYLRPPEEDIEAFLRAVSIYYGDVVLLEPGLVTAYDRILATIGRALGEPTPAGSAE